MEVGEEGIQTLFLQAIKRKRREVTGRKRSEDGLTQGAPYGIGDRNEKNSSRKEIHKADRRKVVNFDPDRIMAGPTGLEPATSGVTGQRSNQLSYGPKRIFGGTRKAPST